MEHERKCDYRIFNGYKPCTCPTENNERATYCESEDILLMSSPPQYRCVRCKETWKQGERPPKCRQPEPQKYQEAQVKITCLSINCPERKSLCCGATSAMSKSHKWGIKFICNRCGKDFKGGECQGLSQEKKEGWEEVHKTLMEELLRGLKEHHFGEEYFINNSRDFIRQTLEAEKERILEALPQTVRTLGDNVIINNVQKVSEASYCEGYNQALETVISIIKGE